MSDPVFPNTITWVIGIAAVLLEFVFTNLAKYEKANAQVSLEALMIFSSLAGLALCLYAFFAISESAKHIQNKGSTQITAKKLEV